MQTASSLKGSTTSQNSSLQYSSDINPSLSFVDTIRYICLSVTTVPHRYINRHDTWPLLSEFKMNFPKYLNKLMVIFIKLPTARYMNAFFTNECVNKYFWTASKTKCALTNYCWPWDARRPLRRRWRPRTNLWLTPRCRSQSDPHWAHPPQCPSSGHPNVFVTAVKLKFSI